MRRAGGITTLILVAALIAPAASTALDGPRAEYRSRVEPICKAEGEAKERIIGGGLRAVVPEGPDSLKQTGRRFVRASKALGRALGDLRSVKRPAEDAERLVNWLDLVSEQVTLLRGAGQAAIDGRRGRAQKLLNRSPAGSRRANNLVVSYEFRHCVFEVAGFTP